MYINDVKDPKVSIMLVLHAQLGFCQKMPQSNCLLRGAGRGGGQNVFGQCTFYKGMTMVVHGFGRAAFGNLL